MTRPGGIGLPFAELRRIFSTPRGEAPRSSKPKNELRVYDQGKPRADYSAPSPVATTVGCERCAKTTGTLLKVSSRPSRYLHADCMKGVKA